MKNLLSIIFMFLVSILNINAETINMETKYAYKNDSIVIRLNTYTGSIQWQESTDSTNWLDIINANSDSLLIIATQNTFYRAQVTAGTCEPFISDTAKIVIKNDLNPHEEFDVSDEPVDLNHEGRNFKSPWGYSKAENSTRLYPLLVSGKWGEGQTNYQQVAKDYPAFVIDYQNTTEGDGQVLARWIKSALDAGYRIDPNRIYLTGFSWGGSSSYPLAKGMFAENMFFAAILRMAGQSQSDLGNAIAQQTAVWYHIGLNDEPVRVQVARAALEFMRNYPCNSDAVETTSSDNITGYERITVTLTRNTNPMFVYSEYTGMGHTSIPCYKDDALFAWLFNHSLEYR